MASKPLTDEQCKQAIDAFHQYGEKKKAADALGLDRMTLHHRIETAKRRGIGVRKSSPAPFISPQLPSKDEPMDVLLQRVRDTSSRTLEAHDARTLIPIQIRCKGPVGIFAMGDPHIDDEGCDFARLEKDLKTVASNERIVGLSIGDVTNNWVGRLERLYASQSVNASDAWRLAEYIFTSFEIPWLAAVNGNHDKWSGHRDPLKWIMKARVALQEDDVVRLALHHPNKAITRIHARHNFKGNSQWNDLHGLKKEVLGGWRDHLLVAGHLHLGEDGGFINPDGFVTQLLRLSGYKRADSYAVAGHFKSKPLHPSALVIICPDKPENERGRVWVAPDIEEGVDYLRFMAKRK